jgi:hypothetical protein
MAVVIFLSLVAHGWEGWGATSKQLWCGTPTGRLQVILMMPTERGNIRQE